MNEITIDINNYHNIEEIENEIINYRNKLILVKFIINEHVIYSNSNNIKDELYLAYYNITKEELNAIKELEKEKNKLKDDIRNIHELKNNRLFNFYLGLSLVHIKDDLKDEFKLEMVRKYSYYQENLIKYVVAILIAISKNIDTISLSLFNIFNTISNEYDKETLLEALDIVLKYSKNYKLLTKNLYAGALDNLQNTVFKKIDANDLKIQELKKTK